MVIELKDIYECNKCFVIIPRKTTDNKLVFLQYVFKRWNDNKYLVNDGGVLCYLGDWEYKL